MEETSDESSNHVYLVTITTKKFTKSKVNDVPKVGGIYRTIEDANKRAQRILRQEYEGEMDPGWFERWADPEKREIHYDAEGCLQMHDFPKEVLECRGYRNLLFVSVTKHKVTSVLSSDEEVGNAPAPSVAKSKKQKRKNTVDGDTNPAPKKIKLKKDSTAESSVANGKGRKAAKIKLLVDRAESAPSYELLTLYRFNVIFTKFDPITLATVEEDILDDRLFLNLAEAEVVFKAFFLNFNSEHEWANMVNIYGAPGVYYCWDNFNENKLRGLYEGITGSVSEEKVNVIFRSDNLNDGMVETPDKRFKVEDWDGTKETYKQHLANNQLIGKPQAGS